MSTVEEKVKNVSEKYGQRISRLVPDPEDLVTCTVCNREIIVMEIFPNAKSPKEISESVSKSIQKQMMHIFSETQREFEPLHETIADLANKNELLEHQHQEISDERDAAVTKFLDIAPRISVMKEIVKAVNNARGNTQAIMQSFRPNDTSMDHQFQILQKVATINTDALDQIYNLIMEVFYDASTPENM